MFYYISFLRPPPQKSQLSSVTITPQLANDLRTELYDGSQEIFYSWSLVSKSPSNHIPVITKPQKLTNWRQESAYKEIQVPLPIGLREGQVYRLVLTSHDQGFPHVINLGGPNTGARPFPVISTSVHFSGRHASTTKQERVERIYRIATSQQDQVYLTVQEQTSFDLDKKVWDSGIGLSSWMVSLASNLREDNDEPFSNALRTLLIESKSCDVIELGAGTGIVSLVLGALRSLQGNLDDRGSIISTDLESAMPLLEENISRNEGLFTSISNRPQPAVLNWEDEHLPTQVTSVSGGFDVIIMADVTYNTASFPALIRTMKYLVNLYDPSLKSQHLQSPLILLGYKERDPAERTLWELAEEIGIFFQKVEGIAGAGGAAIEVWCGRVV